MPDKTTTLTKSKHQLTSLTSTVKEPTSAAPETESPLQVRTTNGRRKKAFTQVDITIDIEK